MARVVFAVAKESISTAALFAPIVIGIGLTCTLDTGGSVFVVNDIVHCTNDRLLIDALIEKTANVVGGSASVARTRIPVWTLEKYRRLGATDARILMAFPGLRPVDLRAAWAFIALHSDEIDRDIKENEES
jgi:uncharacterized protein (DUF433 family)